jgi:uncharacterized membrane protein
MSRFTVAVVLLVAASANAFTGTLLRAFIHSLIVILTLGMFCCTKF